MRLRDYQQRAIDQIMDWFTVNQTGNPCVVMPTGSGKSHVIAAFCKMVLGEFADNRILMLTHVKELIEQNAEKMLAHWPGAPLGVFSAGLRQKNIDQITFGSIQSLRNRAKDLGHIDIILVDECHLINHKNDGSYRKLINKLRKINPEIRVIGLTATPYRLGHGYITDGDGLFSAIIEPVTIEELVHRNFLAPLRSKLTEMQLDVSGVGKRGGEYIENQLQAAVNQRHNNVSAVREVIKRAEDRKAWLFFCTGVEHAEAVRDILLEFGIPAGCVTGDTPAKTRERMLDEFRTGELRAMTNANVLTTGFDYPDIDLIAMLRPTKSTALYVQMAGRGMRPKSEPRDGEDYPVGNCLVMDFAGVVKEHGPITNIQIKSVNSKRKPGEPPVKACPECHELVHLSAMECEACGYKWPQKTKSMTLHDNDIMAVEDATTMEVKSWRWRRHLARSGYYGLSLTYYGEIFDKPVIEYFSVQHPGLGGEVALRKVMELAVASNVRMADLSEETDLQRVADILSAGTAPISIKYSRNERFINVVKREWI
jgi:DNA repair protein RadD